MKIKSSLLLRQVIDFWMVIPMVTDSRSECLMKLNETGALLWKQLQQGAELPDLANALVTEYGISYEQAERDAQQFVQKLKDNDCLE